MVVTAAALPLRSDQQQTQYVQLAPWPCQVPARCFRVSHIIYMLTLCICFQTFFFLVYHIGSSSDAGRRTLRYDEELHAPSTPNASCAGGGELVTYAPVGNITKWRIAWGVEARKFLREYEADCSAGWPPANDTNTTAAGFDNATVVAVTKSPPHVVKDADDSLPLCPCVPSGLRKYLIVLVDTRASVGERT